MQHEADNCTVAELVSKKSGCRHPEIVDEYEVAVRGGFDSLAGCRLKAQPKTVGAATVG